MFKSLIIIFVFSLLNTLNAAPLKILLDPGHGGSDHGAQKNGVRESVITLQVTQKLLHLLKKDDLFHVEMTRTNNSSVSLFSRAEQARKMYADLFISLHVNSSTNPNAKGAEFYIQNQLPPEEESLFLAYKENNEDDDQSRIKNWPLAFVKDYESLDINIKNILHDLNRFHTIKTSSSLAKLMVQNWPGIRKSKKYSIKHAPFYVITNINVPALLIEIGFLSNPKEARLLSNNNYQNKIALGIYTALREYKKTLNKTIRSQLY
ncbi:MAG: N-acetylmuramoyl-L-alanine amidase [Bdellovibrionales bacterium]|nr:N-acetylmuramoyl-L-alanine amidase [Bdellovibrionales bacterium]